MSFILKTYAEVLHEGVLVLCGGGNNGGDGYVVARALQLLGVPVRVLSVKPLADLRGDCKANLESFGCCGGVVEELQESQWQEQIAYLSNCGLLVDAVYGTGLSGATKGFVADMFAFLNSEREHRYLPIVAIDVPSGVEASTGKVHGQALQASATICLQALKIGNVVFPGSSFCGETFCVDIGVSIDSIPVNRFLLNEAYVALVLREFLPTEAEVHKGVRGHLAVLGGSSGRYGAPKLSGEAALRCGAGLVSMFLPASAAAIVSPQCRELMCTALPDESDGHFASESADAVEEELQNKQAMAIGPGLGTTQGAKQLLQRVLEVAAKRKLPLVIDADGLNLLAEHKELQELLGAHVVLTPHPGEMARLVGSSSAEIQQDRLAIAEKYAAKWGCWLVLKGARTIIAGPDGQVSINPAATPVLATAGSGDVLTGVIGAFAASGIPIQLASQCAVFLHGAAGELAQEDATGVFGTTAGDLIRYIPTLMNVLPKLASPPVSEMVQVLPGSLHFAADALAN